MPRTINPILRARIEAGRVVWHPLDKKRWETVKAFLEGQEVDITIGRHHRKRSRSQNSYYWDVVIALVQEAGGFLTDKEAHDAMRLQFLCKHEDGHMATVRSTTELTTVEFSDYVAKIQHLAATMWGIYIPDPNEVPEDHGR